MKGIAVAIFPSKEDLLISYTELEAQGTKDEIRVGKNETLEVAKKGREIVEGLASGFIKKTNTIVPVVFGMHACFN